MLVRKVKRESVRKGVKNKREITVIMSLLGYDRSIFLVLFAILMTCMSKNMSSYEQENYMNNRYTLFF